MSGSKPGERRGGRERGTPNKATAEAKLALAELAREYTDTAMQALAHVAEHGASEAARVAAAVAILDRAYGRPRQSVGADDDGHGPVIYVVDTGVPRSRDANGNPVEPWRE